MKHFVPPPFVVRTRLERLVLVHCAELPELPTIFDAQDLAASRDDFLAQVVAFQAFAAGAIAMYRRAGIEVDTGFCGGIDDLVTDCIRVPLDEHAQAIRDAA